jgi:hypothetical protein
LVSQEDISGASNHDWHLKNKLSMILILLVFQLEISGKYVKDLHPEKR